MKSRPVVVDWIDAHSGDAWTHNPKTADSDFEVRSCGWVLFKSSKRLVIAQSVGEGGAFAGLLTIPRRWVKRIR